MRSISRFFFSAVVVLYCGANSLSAQEGAAARVKEAQTLHVPKALDAEHQQLHVQLARAITVGGRTGEAAKEVDRLLAQHFRKEEEFALPLLGLLPSLAAGNVPAETSRAIALADRLKSEMPGMLLEHKAIAAAVQRLRTAALRERQDDAVRFAETLMSHAQQEEQIHYPSAVLVGEYLKLKR